MSKKLNEMLEEFKDYASLKGQVESQKTEISQLKSKISELESENSQLKLLTNGISVQNTIPDNRLEEVIALKQLDFLNEQSQTRSLTLEETRKVEIYTKVLTISRSGKSKNPSAAEKKEIGELLSLVEGGRIE